MNWRTVYTKLVFGGWNLLPGKAQISISNIWAWFYTTHLSALLIGPYCRINGLGSSYLSDFLPDNPARTYFSFQDFFTRKLAKPLDFKNRFIWPAEGYVCEQGRVDQLSKIFVKGQSQTISQVFGIPHKEIENHFYTNIFLHNHNYHRIHSPVSGIIRSIEKIPGRLDILRPWFYRRDQVSMPALKNERVNVQIEDEMGRPWYLSIVGGMGVGTIRMSSFQVGSAVSSGEELGYFLLGSTCCIASPVQPLQKSYLQKVEVGEDMCLLSVPSSSPSIEPISDSKLGFTLEI